MAKVRLVYSETKTGEREGSSSTIGIFLQNSAGKYRLKQIVDVETRAGYGSKDLFRYVAEYKPEATIEEVSEYMEASNGDFQSFSFKEITEEEAKEILSNDGDNDAMSPQEFEQLLDNLMHRLNIHRLDNFEKFVQLRGEKPEMPETEAILQTLRVFTPSEIWVLTPIGAYQLYLAAQKAGKDLPVDRLFENWRRGEVDIKQLRSLRVQVSNWISPPDCFYKEWTRRIIDAAFYHVTGAVYPD